MFLKSIMADTAQADSKGGKSVAYPPAIMVDTPRTRLYSPYFFLGEQIYPGT
jgi:hypothetical protein